MTWRTRRMMRRSKPRVSNSQILETVISVVWPAVALAALAVIAIGMVLYFPGTNAIENPVVQLP